MQSIQAVRAATNSKFLAPGEVILGGFEKVRDELVLIKNLVIAANGPSRIAADYGSFLFRALGPGIFNSITVVDGFEVPDINLHLMQFAGYLTLSQSGESEVLANGVKRAAKLGLSCINVVNVEDSRIARVITEMASKQPHSHQDDIDWFESENIGMYMKSGVSYSDVKSFMPEVICLALVGLWFSHAKSTVKDKSMLDKRIKLQMEIERLPARLDMLMEESMI